VTDDSMKKQDTIGIFMFIFICFISSYATIRHMFFIGLLLVFLPRVKQLNGESIECVRCHAIENKIKNHASDKVKKLWYCLRCVRCPKVEIFVEMSRTILQSLVWNRHVGGPL